MFAYEDIVLFISLLVLLLVIGYIIYIGILKEQFYNQSNRPEPITTVKTVEFECSPCYSYITGTRTDSCKRIVNDSVSTIGQTASPSTAPSTSPISSIYMPITPILNDTLPATISSSPASLQSSQSVVQTAPSISSYTPYITPTFPSINMCIQNWDGRCIGNNVHSQLSKENQTLFVIITTTDDRQIYLPVYKPEFVIANINTSPRVKEAVYTAKDGINLCYTPFNIKDINNKVLNLPYNIKSIAVPSGYQGLLTVITKNGVNKPSVYLQAGQVSTLSTPISIDTNMYKEVKLSILLLQ